MPSGVGGSANALLNRQWWRVCFVHGDQTKYYRQLYGHKRAAIRSTQMKNAAAAAEASETTCTSTQQDIACG